MPASGQIAGCAIAAAASGEGHEKAKISDS
jgi:hypothetical protein